MIFFEYHGRDPVAEHRFREAFLVALTALVAVVLLPFTILLAAFWAAWGLAAGLKRRPGT